MAALDWRNLVYKKENHIGVITLNRPEVLNALNSEMVQEIIELFDDISSDEDIKAVIVTGSTRVFAAGADIAYMAHKNPIEAESWAALCHQAANEIANLSKPVIAAINGLALGGGCELALACDIRMAAQGSKMGFPEINLGIMPTGGGTQRLTRLVGEGWAKQLILTGDPIDAETALKIGLVTKIFPAEILMEEVKKLALLLASKAPFAIKAAKNSINFAGDANSQLGMLLEQKMGSLLFATQDQKEGMKAFIEKRQPVFQGK